MNKILSILGGVCLLLLSSCKSEEALLTTSAGPEVSVAMTSEDLRSLNYTVDDTSTYPYLSHSEEQVVVHCYFRSDDASQPATYLPLTWTRVKDSNGKSTNKLQLKRQTIEMVAGTDISKGKWYVAGIISSQVGSTGIINLDASKAVNLTTAKTITGNVDLTAPYGFAWTPLVLENKTQFSSISVVFKPMATLFTVQISREEAGPYYVVNGIELRSPRLSASGTIDPLKDPITPGTLPSITQGTTGIVRTMDVNFDFGQVGTTSPVYAFWAIGADANTTQKSEEQLYALIKTTNEFGQTYNRRYLLSNKKEVLRRNGYRYTLAPPPIGPQVSTSLSYVTDYNVGLNGFRSSSLSHAIDQNAYFSLSDIQNPDNAPGYGTSGYSSIWFPVAQDVGYDNATNLFDMSAEAYNLFIPSEDLDFNVAMSSTQPTEFYAIPNGGLLGETTYSKSLGDGVIYSLRETSGNNVNGWASIPTAYRYDMIPNPDGEGLALRVMSRRLSDDTGWSSLDDKQATLENKVTKEEYWSRAPHNYVTRIFPAMGVYKGGQLVGRGTDVVFIAKRRYIASDRPYVVITINQTGIKHEYFDSDPGYRTGLRLMRSHNGGGTSGAIGD